MLLSQCCVPPCVVALVAGEAGIPTRLGLFTPVEVPMTAEVESLSSCTVVANYPTGLFCA